jgi:outer membrane protein OmpA-like peptidoglycan-associated protein
MAPDAELVFVHHGAATGERGNNLGDSVALVEAIDFVATVAGRRPWVLSLSMGQLAGAHDASTLTVQAIDSALATPGRCVLHSTGNYRSRPIHTQGLLRPGEVLEIGFHTGEEDGFAHEIDIWYSGHDRITIEVLGPSGELAAHAPTGSSAELNFRGGSVGRLYNRRYDPNNHDNEARLYLYPAAPRGAWRLRFRAVDVVDGRFHCWIERDQTCSTCQPAFDDADVVRTSTTNNICNGLLSIAVGAYDPHQPERPLAPFSSWGPARDGRFKPDVVAPGVAILSARSAASPPVADASLVARMSGTSMACPYVAGLVALMFQAAGRRLPTRRTRELLLKVAEPLAEDVPREGWGSGYAVVADAVAAAVDEAQARPRLGRSSEAAALASEARETPSVETPPETTEWATSSAASLAEDDRPVVPAEIQLADEAAGGPVLAGLAYDSAEAAYEALPIGLGCDSAEAGDEALPIELGCDSAEAADEASPIASGCDSAEPMDHAVWTELRDGEGAAAEAAQSPAATSLTGICRVAADITFATAKSFIRPRYKPVIEAAFIGAVDRPASGPVVPRADRQLLVTGHTDTQGSRAINNPLSQRRAQAAVAVLSQDRGCLGADRSDRRLVARHRRDRDDVARSGRRRERSHAHSTLPTRSAREARPDHALSDRPAAGLVAAAEPAAAAEFSPGDRLKHARRPRMRQGAPAQSPARRCRGKPAGGVLLLPVDGAGRA